MLQRLLIKWGTFIPKYSDRFRECTCHWQVCLNRNYCVPFETTRVVNYSAQCWRSCSLRGPASGRQVVSCCCSVRWTSGSLDSLKNSKVCLPLSNTHYGFLLSSSSVPTYWRRRRSKKNFPSRHVNYIYIIRFWTLNS